MIFIYSKKFAGFFLRIDLVNPPGPGPISIIVEESGSDFITILSVRLISNKKF